MRPPARTVSLRGEVEHRHEADQLLHVPGDAALVRRGRPRSLILACPDGCGETLAVNLDARSGPAWSFYGHRGSVSLFPSVWREGGCESHFIVWRGNILWCDRYEDGNHPTNYDRSLEERVLQALEPDRYQGYTDLAAQLDEIPWEVSWAARQLVHRGLAEAGSGPLRDSFRRAVAEIPLSVVQPASIAAPPEAPVRADAPERRLPRSLLRGWAWAIKHLGWIMVAIAILGLLLGEYSERVITASKWQLGLLAVSGCVMTLVGIYLQAHSAGSGDDDGG